MCFWSVVIRLVYVGIEDRTFRICSKMLSKLKVSPKFQRQDFGVLWLFHYVLIKMHQSNYENNETSLMQHFGFPRSHFAH